MKCKSKSLSITAGNFSYARIYQHSDGSVVCVSKRGSGRISRTSKRGGRFPPVNRNEPMTKAAFKKTLNRYFERLCELDLDNEKCLYVTLTISNAKYNSYDLICSRFKYFVNLVKDKVQDDYVGVMRFVEMQAKGFFHIHCILVFKRKNINLSWRDFHKFWGWGYVRVQPVKNRFGLFDYSTNKKHGAENDDKFTRYPKGAKIIYISPNLPKSKGEFISTISSEYTELLNDSDYVHAKTHKYIETNTNQVRTRIDRFVLVKNKPKKEDD